MTVTTGLADRPAPGTGRTRPHLLVADDVPVLRRLLAEALGAEGFDVTAVPDGMAALNAYPEVRPDLVLTDLRMPGSTGSGWSWPCANAGASAGLLMLTARDDALTRRTAAAVGVDELLPEPFGLAELAARIRGAPGSAAGRV